MSPEAFTGLKITKGKLFTPSPLFTSNKLKEIYMTGANIL